jgi:cobalt/nickel transport system ATP-binding protein
LIRLKGIELGFPHRGAVLDKLDFHLPEGKRLGLVGANGSGKTSMLHVIMGLVTPDAGSVELFGQECSDEEGFQRARRDLGFVFQDADDQLFCPTVAEDVAFGPRNLGKSADEAHDIVHRTLDLLKIEHLESRVTHNLSGGEKRLVALATVMSMEPSLLILDEPTTGLDEATAERLLQILDDHVTTCLIVSHDRAFLGRAVDEVVRLEEGRISQ